MKKHIISILLLTIMIICSLSACGKKQETTDTKDAEIVQETADITDTEDAQKTDEKKQNLNTEKNVTSAPQAETTDDKTSKKETLTVTPAGDTDNDPNTEELIVTDKEGNSANVQIGVVESDEVIPDAPDSSSNEKAGSLPSVTKPSEDKKNPSGTTGGKVGSGWDTTYEEYEAMSGTDQTLFYYSFANAEEFIEWYNDAKAEYEANHEDIYIGEDGVVNAGEMN